MIPPSGRVPEKGPDWFLVDTEACGGGTSHLGLFLGVSVFIGFFSIGIMRGCATGGPHATRSPGATPGSPSKLPVSFIAKKKSPKSFVPFQLRLIWIFCETKTGQKQQLARGTRLIG
jgi:hypothetical protein